MKDKLEVGMYVRILWDNGEQTISKCTNKVDIGDTQYSKNDFYIHTDKKGEVIYKSMIVKASHNIIDLIEVGDYVNGERVIALKKDISERNIHMNSKGNSIFVDYDLVNDWYYGIDDEKIKSIVTKEQFESMEYRLGDDK